MASDDIACRILIQNEQLEHTFPYIGSLITEDEIPHQAKRGQAIGESLQKILKVTAYEDMTNESVSVACSDVRL